MVGTVSLKGGPPDPRVQKKEAGIYLCYCYYLLFLELSLDRCSLLGFIPATKEAGENRQRISFWRWENASQNTAILAWNRAATHLTSACYITSYVTDWRIPKPAIPFSFSYPPSVRVLKQSLGCYLPPTKVPTTQAITSWLVSACTVLSYCSSAWSPDTIKWTTDRHNIICKTILFVWFSFKGCKLQGMVA